ncbi:hypothetical protein [Streptomyces sp. NPDC048603]|uniref:hypothetical protein n=1 Tax=Streptomyces sp. NPDC048603 TaxID=3365577 RepID=UPI0037201558
MSGRRSLDWLGLTPEPERELPAAVAALRAAPARPPGPYPGRPGDPGHRPVPPPPPPPPPADLADAERRRVERLILRGSRHSWLRYLAEVTDLVTAVAAGSRPGDPAAALLAGEVVLDHHRMLIGLPGAGYGRTAADRAALEEAVRILRAHLPTGDRP